MKWWKIPAVIFCALFVTALGIDAADTFSGSSKTLLASLFFGESSDVCPAGMVFLATETNRLCIDQYEAGVGADCATAEPASVQQTGENIKQVTCQPVSQAGVLPWRFVTYRQAEQLCARSGKRLISAAEWYQSALGTVDSSVSCATNASLQATGAKTDCRSGIGAYDMIGNVWEFVSGEVIDGFYSAIPLPLAGYVLGVNDAGIPNKTGSSSDVLYGSDYFWVETPGNFAMMRGGYYGASTDAGLYSVQAAVPQDLGSTAIGFRCAYSL